MASNACFATFAAAEELQMTHHYGLAIPTLATKIMISSLLIKADKLDVEGFLLDTYTSKKQVILAPYYGGNTFSSEDIAFEALEEICAFKPSSEPSPVLGSYNLMNILHTELLILMLMLMKRLLHWKT